jgi:hypothetical protein
VVHINAPPSLEAFYQESGRAGRDGLPARSVVMYSWADRRRFDFILQQELQKAQAAAAQTAPAATAASTQAAKKQRRSSPAGDDEASSDDDGTAAAAGSKAGGAKAGGSKAAAPQIAAAALRAWGEVIAYCMEPSCRRARLLSHFGERVPQQRQQVTANAGPPPPAPRCCDVCDDPAAAAAAAAQQRELEASALLSRGGWRRGGNGKGDAPGGGAQDWGHGGLRRNVGSGWGFDDGGSSGDEQGGSDTESEREDEGEEAEAASALDQAKRKAPAALLVAMERAEAAAARRARQEWGGGGEGDALDRRVAAAAAAGVPPSQVGLLYAFGRPCSKKHPASSFTQPSHAQRQPTSTQTIPLTHPTAQARVDAAKRQSVRDRLAQLITSNPALRCTDQQASALASALEQAVHAPAGIGLHQYTSAATALAAALRKAVGWWALAAWGGAVEGEGQAALVEVTVSAAEAAVVSAVAAAVAAAKQDGAGSGEGERALKELSFLAELDVSAGLLQTTQAGKRVRALSKCAAGGVGQAAARVVEAWKRRLKK